MLAEGGFGCKAIREKECTLAEDDYKLGWTGINTAERKQWIVDIDEKWYWLEKLPASEVQVKKRKARKRRRVSEKNQIVEEEENNVELDGVDGETGDVE